MLCLYGCHVTVAFGVIVLTTSVVTLMSLLSVLSTEIYLSLVSVDVVPRWPQMYLEVSSLDSWQRHRTEGYGYFRLPQSAGELSALTPSNTCPPEYFLSSSSSFTCDTVLLLLRLVCYNVEGLNRVIC